MTENIQRVDSKPEHGSFGHERLGVYKRAIEFVVWSEEFLTRTAGNFAAKEHLCRAADGIPANIADANSNRSRAMRGQLVEVALGSTLEFAACLDVAVCKGACAGRNVATGKILLWQMACMLVKLRQSGSAREELHEEAPLYGAPQFSHERLHVYRATLRYVSWSHLLCQVYEAAAPVSAKLDAASTGIALNLAEGNGRFAAKERCRFLLICRSRLRCVAPPPWIFGRPGST